MDTREIHFHIQRILSAKIFFKYKNKVYRIIEPFSDLLLEAEYVYFSALKKLSHLPSIDDLFNSKLGEKRVETLEKQIYDLKFSIFLALEAHNFSLYQHYKKLIRELKKQLKECDDVYASLMGYSREGIAANIKYDFLIVHSIYDYSKKKVCKTREISDFDDDLLAQAKKKYFSNRLSYNQLRELSKSSEWRHLWNITKNRPFKRSAASLTDEQKYLMIFSYMYDTLYKSLDTPSDMVINDDDAMDGWFIAEKHKQDKEKDNRRSQSLNEFRKLAASIK